MSQAFISCPNTGRYVYVGLDIEWLALEGAEIEDQEIECPACGERHHWTKKDLVLRADGGG